MKASIRRLGTLPVDLLAVAGGAVVLRLLAGVGFANYDTLYALAWGGQLGRGEAPDYAIAIAPTPHPLLELIGAALTPLGPRAVEHVTVALGFLALSGCGWLLYRLGAAWFGRAAGAVAALVFITRVPVLSYGVRAYVDLPYLLLILGALLVETHRRRAGAPVLALLALAGLLRPEAWAFSALYWLYVVGWTPRFAERPLRAVRERLSGDTRATASREAPPRARGELVWLALLAACGPLVWLLSDLAVTGDALWSLKNTRHTASTFGRVTGIGNVPEYIPRRIGEILRPPVLAGAAVGGVLTLWWLRRSALLGAATGVLAVVVFAAFAALGLPINTRYAFLAAAILCLFCGAGVFGWTRMARGDRRRRRWLVAGAVVLVALIAYGPAQYRSTQRELDKLARQHGVEADLVALVDSHAVNLRCGPVGVPNHAPIPLLALYLKTSPKYVVSLQVGHIGAGVYVDPASKQVEVDYVLDRRDPHQAVTVPPGFSETRANRSWLIFQRCA